MEWIRLDSIKIAHESATAKGFRAFVVHCSFFRSGDLHLGMKVTWPCMQAHVEAQQADLGIVMA